jgi:hypothetical protein
MTEKSVMYGLVDENRYVYHYTKASTLAELILPTGKIRFSRFGNVNDPRESKNWRFGYGNLKRNEDLDVEHIDASFNAHMKHKWRVGCFVSDVIEAVSTKAREDAGADMLAVLYERGHSRPAMWAHYGENYGGACLVFEKAALDRAVRTAAGPNATVHSSRVTYNNPLVALSLSRPDALMIDVSSIHKFGLEAAARKHSEEHRDILFLKASDWAPEREFRWVVTATTEQEFFVDIAGSLAAIVMGDRFPNDLRAIVGEYALRDGIDLAETNWTNGVPQLQPLHPRLVAGSP